MAARDAGADPGGRRQEGRRARHRAHRRHHGGQAHARADPALPSAAAHQDRASISTLTTPCPACASRAEVEGHRPDRRRDGGADRRLGRLPDGLRHGQGGRPRHAHRGHPPRRKDAAAAPGTYGPTADEPRPLLPVDEALARVLASAREPLAGRERAARGRARPHARERRRGAARRSRRSPPRPWTATRCARADIAAAPVTPAVIGASAAGRRLRPGRSGPARPSGSSPARRCPTGADAIVIQENAAAETAPS